MAASSEWFWMSKVIWRLLAYSHSICAHNKRLIEPIGFDHLQTSDQAILYYLSQLRISVLNLSLLTIYGFVLHFWQSFITFDEFFYQFNSLDVLTIISDVFTCVLLLSSLKRIFKLS